MTPQNAPIIKNLIDLSFVLAISLDQTTITEEHILHSILMSDNIRTYMNSNGISIDQLIQDVRKFIVTQTPFLQNKIPSDDPNIMTGQITAAVQRVLVASYTTASKQHRDVNYADIIRNLLLDVESYSRYFLMKYGIVGAVVDGLEKVVIGTEQKSALAEFCVNLNDKVKGISDVLIGRKTELFNIAHSLSKKKKNNVLIVGEAGVGKCLTYENKVTVRVSDEIFDYLKKIEI